MAAGGLVGAADDARGKRGLESIVLGAFCQGPLDLRAGSSSVSNNVIC